MTKRHTKFYKKFKINKIIILNKKNNILMENEISENLVIKENENLITEGKASIYLENIEKTFSAFYNPAQVVFNYINRNLTEIYLSFQ